MPYNQKMKMGFMFARPGRTNDQWAPPEDTINEMPHLESFVSIDGQKVEVIDLRIELYPITGQEKSSYFKSFKETGLVGRTKGGQWLLFKPDGVVNADAEDVASSKHMPDYWEDMSVKLLESFSYSLKDFMKG